MCHRGFVLLLGDSNVSRSADPAGGDWLAEPQFVPRIKPAEDGWRDRAFQAAPSDGATKNRPRAITELDSQSLGQARLDEAEKRRVRVALLIEEEGLGRGAMTRIAGWLAVSPSTIARDI